jgi:hypothetical protein
MTVASYDGRVPRVAPRRLLPLICGTVLLSACGSPPEPPQTSPPQPSRSIVVPTASLPSGYPGVPQPTLPTTTYPAPTLPTLPVPTTRPTRTTPPTTSPPPGAPRCTGGPSGAQVLAVVKGRPGIPDDNLDVTEGPYCAGSWQFTILGIAGQDEDSVEPLLVVTSGRPSSLTVVEAGTDVCTDRVEDDAPPGIRVRACGS